jgi:hypothetical protein
MKQEFRKRTEERITTKPRRKQIKSEEKIQNKVGMDKRDERKRMELQEAREKEYILE